MQDYRKSYWYLRAKVVEIIQLDEDNASRIREALDRAIDEADRAGFPGDDEK